jgi:hypothetical protein
MMRAFPLRWHVSFAVIVLVAACSSDDGASEGTAAPPSERTAATVQAEIEDAADALVDQWGSDRDAFFVIAWSLDAGYSAAQIITAAVDEQVRVDGTIAGPIGSVLEPEYEPAGLLAPLEGNAAQFGPVVAVAAIRITSALGRLAEDTPSNAEVSAIGLLSEVFDAGLAAMETINEKHEFDVEAAEMALELAARGYSGKQILQGFLRGQLRDDLNESVFCYFLVSVDGRMVRPVNPPSDILIELNCPPFPDDAPYEVTATTAASTTTTTAPTERASSTTTTTTMAIPALAFPRTYVGGGSVTWSFSYHNGSCLVEGDTMELTLNADGTVTGSYRRISRSFDIRDATGVGRETVECGDQIFTKDPVEMTGSHTPPTPGTDEPGTIVAEIAVWPDWHIEGEYTPNEMTFEWEVSYTASGYEGDAPDPRVINYVHYQLLFVDEG